MGLQLMIDDKKEGAGGGGGPCCPSRYGQHGGPTQENVMSNELTMDSFISVNIKEGGGTSSYIH